MRAACLKMSVTALGASAIAASALGCASIIGADFDRADDAVPSADAAQSTAPPSNGTVAPSVGGGGGSAFSADDASSGATTAVPTDDDGGTSATGATGGTDGTGGNEGTDGGSVVSPTDGGTVVHPADGGNPDGVYILNAGSVDAGISLDDTLMVYVNGTHVATANASGGSVAPVSFDAAVGDRVVVEFFDAHGGPKAHAAVYLSGAHIATQQVKASFSGVGSYPADTVQPYDVAPFEIPASGKTATIDCLPSIALNTAPWTLSPNLQIRTATTLAYDLTWTVNNHLYNYTPDCQGWVTDVFIANDGSWANVGWNTITHALRTSAVSGHTYSATADAQYAVQTLYPGGDLNLLTIQ